MEEGCLAGRKQDSRTKQVIKKELGSFLREIDPYVSFESYPPNFELAESKETWQDFYDSVTRFLDTYKSSIYAPYLGGIKNLSLVRKRIPSLDDLYELLEPAGWRPIWVNGYVPSRVYSGLIARKYFPVANVIRRKVHLNFSPVPDFIHDIFGHLPLLYDKEYSQYLVEIASALEKAETNSNEHILYEAQAKLCRLRYQLNPEDSEVVTKAKEDLRKIQDLVRKSPSEQIYLSSLFLWSIEFGLIKDGNNMKIIGAGLLSSPKECTKIITQNVNIKPYSLEVIRETFTPGRQLTFFTTPDFDSWHNVLKDFLSSYEKSPKKIGPSNL